MNKQEPLQDVQKICLDIYKEFKSICDRHELRYYAIGGTCIGAVRHQGFIPWDDDIDIAMPYSDLCMFIRYANTELPPEYEVYSPFDHISFGEIFIKIVKRQTTFVLLINKNIPNSFTGIGIDVMPIFGMPKSRKEQQRVAAINDFYVRSNSVMHYPFFAQKTILSKCTWILSYPIQKLFANHNYWLRRILKQFSSTPFDNSDKVLFAWRLRRKKGESGFYDSVFEYEDFETYVELPFEDTTMRVPVGYDRYLTHDFGDYMTLPPKEKQISHDTYIIDYNKSYYDYIIERQNRKKEK